MLLDNLKELKKNMEENNWVICSFLFRYKEIEYIVLVKLFAANERRENTYALVKMQFIKHNNLNEKLEIEANSLRLIIDRETFRIFFGIEYGFNPGDIIEQFTKRLGEKIPTIVPNNVSKAEKDAMVASLSRSDSEEPNKTYCYKVKRNSLGNKRSQYNSNKTRILRPELFKKFEDDPSISFCYTDDSSKENDDSTILYNFSKQLIPLK